MILARGTPGFSGADLQNMVKCVLCLPSKNHLDHLRNAAFIPTVKLLSRLHVKELHP